MEVNVIGGGWVTAIDFGRMTAMTPQSKPTLIDGDPVIPPASEIYSVLPVRYRRLDTYSKVGCAAIALALKDAGMNQADTKQPIGIVAGTRFGCSETDLAYFKTAKEDGGVFASPNLFSFTLPGIAIGEAAIHFKLVGPVFTVGDNFKNRGRTALSIAVDLLASGTCRTIIAGWLDVWKHPPQTILSNAEALQGAIFVVLSNGYQEKSILKIKQKKFELFTAVGRKVNTIIDLFSL
jgi:3-oxoacyl-[acyl-carrier-protein] synthase II